MDILLEDTPQGTVSRVKGSVLDPALPCKSPLNPPERPVKAGHGSRLLSLRDWGWGVRGEG